MLLMETTRVMQVGCSEAAMRSDWSKSARLCEEDGDPTDAELKQGCQLQDNYPFAG